MKCEYCEKNIKNLKNIKKHVSKFHPEKVAILEHQCPVCPETFSSIKGFSIHVNKKHSDAISPEEFFRKYVHIDCKFCGKKLEYATRYPGDFCSQAHAVSHRNLSEGKELPFDCAICGSKYVDLRHLGHHVSNVHREVDIEQYYIDHYKKSPDEDKCKWCKKPMKFISLTKGYTDFCYNTNCNVLWHNENNNRHVNAGVNIAKAHAEHPEKVNTNIEYWLDKGYSPEEAAKQLTKRQITFSKEICIAKHGEEKGLEVWKARQEKWLSNYERKTYSKISQKLFWEIYNKIKDDYSEIYFATLDNGVENIDTNKEYLIRTNQSIRMLDFYVKDTNKCIEFDGDYWHSEARGNQERDRNRENEILEVSPSMKILHILEMEYRKHPEETLDKCMEFLND